MFGFEEKLLSVDTKYLRLAKRILLVLALLLYVLFLYGDIKGGKSTAAIKYIALWVAVLISACHFQQWTGRITIVAMFIGAIADAFLLLAGKTHSAGIAVFCIVQILYFARLRIPVSTKDLIKAILLRVGMIAILGVFIVLLQVKNKQGIFVAVYFLLLLSNLFDSMSIASHEEDRGTLFTWGLIFFVLCDICMGLFNYESEMIDFIRSPVEIGMWLFYYPSQVLIAASAGRFRLVEEKQRIRSGALEQARAEMQAEAEAQEPAAAPEPAAEKPSEEPAAAPESAPVMTMEQKQDVIKEEVEQEALKEFGEGHEPELVFDAPEETE